MILTPKQLSERSKIYVGSCHDAIERMAPSSVSLVEPSEPEEKSVKPTFGAEIECPKCHHKWTEKKS